MSCCVSFTSREAFTAAARLNEKTCHGTHSTAGAYASQILLSERRCQDRCDSRGSSLHPELSKTLVFFSKTRTFSEAAEKRSLKRKVYSVHRTTSSCNRRGERSARLKERGTLSPGEDASSSRRNLPLETPRGRFYRHGPAHCSAHKSQAGASRTTRAFPHHTRPPGCRKHVVVLFWEVAPRYIKGGSQERKQRGRSQTNVLGRQGINHEGRQSKMNMNGIFFNFPFLT